ncbi:MAG: hypothetical protein MUC63_10875, partial [Planctomycetes bacterium]|nr:hypothetical protein [Planctomycetota bacterium]
MGDKPRKSEVPLIVWKRRKTRFRTSRSPGEASTASRSRPRAVSISPASARKSRNTSMNSCSERPLGREAPGTAGAAGEAGGAGG